MKYVSDITTHIYNNNNFNSLFNFLCHTKNRNTKRKRLKMTSPTNQVLSCDKVHAGNKDNNRRKQSAWTWFNCASRLIFDPAPRSLAAAPVRCGSSSENRSSQELVSERVQIPALVSAPSQLPPSCLCAGASGSSGGVLLFD